MSKIVFGTLGSIDEAYDLWGEVGLRVDIEDSSRETSWQNYFESTPENFFAAYDHLEKLIGVAVLFFDGRKAGIYRVAVRETYRKMGVARKLIRLAQDAGRRIGAGSLYVLIEDKSSASEALFMSEGFECLDSVRYYVRSI